LDRVDRILVEPTGLARPADLVDTLRRAPFSDRLAPTPLVVVVDPHALATGATPHDHVDQLAAAEVVVINKVDLAAPEELAAVRARLAELWPGPAEVHEVSFGQVPASLLRASDGKDRPAPAHPHDHHHGDSSARSLRFDPEAVFRLDALRGLLERLPLDRAKGLFRTDEGWRLLQRAGGRVSAEPTGWRADSRVDAIATDPASLEGLEAALESCLAPSATLGSLEVAWEGGSRAFDREALRSMTGREPDVSARFPKRQGSGVSLRSLLAAAGAPLEGSLVVAAADGYVSDPVEVARALDGVLVDSLGDGPLPASQGGPFRLLVPGDVPCANVKSVVRMVARR
jgi:hypothetical protein